jgi:hypothetical protein
MYVLMIENMTYAHCVMCRFPWRCALNGRSNVVYSTYTNNAGIQPIRDLRLRFVATRLPGLRVRMPPVSWMSVYSEYCVVSGKGLCDGPIPRAVGWVSECDLETSRVQRSRPGWGCWATRQKKICEPEVYSDGILLNCLPYDCARCKVSKFCPFNLYVTSPYKYPRFYNVFNGVCGVLNILLEWCSSCYIRRSLTLRWLMSYIYGAPIPDVSRSHTTTQHSR